MVQKQFNRYVYASFSRSLCGGQAECCSAELALNKPEGWEQCTAQLAAEAEECVQRAGPGEESTAFQGDRQLAICGQL
jgi:hypothetical protein